MPLRYADRFGPIQCPGCKEFFVQRRKGKCPHCQEVEFLKAGEYFAVGVPWKQYVLDDRKGRLILLEDLTKGVRA